jgi:hypothetical protein
MDLKWRQQHFGEVFEQQYCWMHKMFSMGLHSFKCEKETTIDDLIQDTGKLAWENYCKPQNAGKSVAYLIRQKAKNVLSDFYVDQKKSPVRLEGKIHSAAIPSFEKAFEARDLLNMLEDEGKLCYWACQLMNMGYSYEEIQHIFDLPKSIKMKVCRYRKKIKAKGIDPF